MRHQVLIALLVAMVAGCMGSSRSPVVPGSEGGALQADSLSQRHTPDTGRYRLWQEGRWFINAAHDRVDVVPLRGSRFHLNALKFLESYCSNCLQITGLKKNGDSTVDLSVKITHPFHGYPEYTGFDVKGILMFNGSWENPGHKEFPPYPEPFRISWRKLGDPQVLNADGYTLRWSPSYDSGSSLPIFNYWEGKYATGTPTANVNAYLDFYTTENRHMFEHWGQVTRTYHIWLPPGQPVVAGYAVEACWEPPTVTPVTNPASDFPATANQPEAYKFFCSVNDGQPITDPECCGQIYDPSEGYMYSKQWGGHTAKHFAWYTDYFSNSGMFAYPCGDEWIDEYCILKILPAGSYPDGDYIGVAINFRGASDPPWKSADQAYSILEFTIDLQ